MGFLFSVDFAMVFSIMEVMIKETEIHNVAQKVIQNYKPERIYLFGSFAWGKPTADSDVDLFIVKETQERKFDRQLKVRRIINGSLPVDILVYNNKELQERIALGDFFVKTILKKGKLLYDGSTN